MENKFSQEELEELDAQLDQAIAAGSDNQGGVATPDQVEDSPSASVATVKIVSNKTHLGPVTGKMQKTNKLSAAANKIRINNDLKVTLKSEEGKKSSFPKKTSNNKTSESLCMLDSSKDVSAKDALLIMEAWDQQFSGPGTPDYVKKANALNYAQSAAYTKLGINPNAGVRPELTEEQRSSYNDMVSPCAFDYYEVRISFKQPGQKSVRSTTYRYLDRPNLKQINNLLLRQVKVLDAKLSVSAAPTN